MTVCVLGDLNVDLELVVPNATSTDVQEPTMSGGGSAANAAAGLATLGIDARFVGAVGNDAFGDAALESLHSAGVDTSEVRVVTGANTVAVLVVVPPDGERLIYVWPPTGGAHLDLDRATAVAAVAGTEWVHVSGIALRGEPAASSIIEAMRAAHRDGIRVSLDLNLRLENWGWGGGFREVIGRAVESADVVFGSVVDELIPLSGADGMEAALEQLSGERIVVGRLGREGAVAHDGYRVVRAAGFEVGAVDTVGAGDAFDAGFIAARLRGEDLSGALRYANAVAAITVTRPGARDTPTTAEVADFIDLKTDR